MISIITFGSSFLLLVILFVGKSSEQKSGNKNFINKAAGLLDGLASKILDFLYFRWKQISQTVRYIIFIMIPHRSEEAFRQMKGKAVNQYNKQRDSLMGKKDLVSSSSASFFIKKIREDKKNTKEGKIDDLL
jgi:hypothetical protein